ncbi:UV damage endonuclease UvsE [Paenibacillus sp. J31TS4]|uniref:UV DNA damage repair endonuclease UvsE n=1 Tax=Paenibacillus sp. J31TS4 TaxID=2807195 RepID=UPI001B184508|nr:UV DNA damage repair endonuclease UvsE [Paenibacillus sp. J31TS4]GIP41091.1 UV damage endonuclease UvsE [Paenibacillus sp. J31TS4]
MIVRFGYVAMSLLVKNASPSKTITYASFSKLTDREAAIRKLERIAEENLHNTLRLLRHNRAYEIELYRLSSRLVPLVGHEELADWDPFPALADKFAEVGRYVREHGMRISFHPDHFTVLSTPREEVLRTSVADLERHTRMLELMGLDERARNNIHIGGTYGNKEASLLRFVEQASALPKRVLDRLTLENDDKTFTAAETLEACERVGVPMVLDLHHHEVNPGGEKALALWPRILDTWRRLGPRGEAEGADGRADNRQLDWLPPKIHVSSPRSDKDPRAHADFVDAGHVLRFLREIAPLTPRLDVMIEAKSKDEALLRLMEELGAEPDVRVRTQASVEIGY